MLVQRLSNSLRSRDLFRTICEHGRKMLHTKNKKPHHLERTASSSRAVKESSAVVKEIKSISPTVKSLSLAVKEKDLTFSPGQWVDFTIPGVDIVGGYSMSSAPRLLHRDGELHLAVKYSTYPPALWVHTQCTVGSQVLIRVGGDFYYDPSRDSPPHSLLLLAGGVGINPMYSILQHVVDLREEGQTIRLSILYSASKTEELIFKDEIKELTAGAELTSRFFVTQEECSNQMIQGRINKEVLSTELEKLREGGLPVTTFICGPGPMIDTMETLLLELGQEKSTILYEKWW